MTLDRSWLAWNDGTIRKLARLIYEERRFDDLPMLADALEDAGCTDADILMHCRGYDSYYPYGGYKEGDIIPARMHVRGCWVVDLLLNKE